MESMRDINRVMEREIAKGSCPLKLDHIEFGDYSYQEITSKEKLLEVLSYLLRIEYSCAVTPQVRQTGNRLSGLAGTAYASLLT